MSEAVTPKVGEFWSGQSGDFRDGQIRKLKILEVLGAGKEFRVSFTKRGEGTRETTIPLYQLNLPWDEHTARQKERKEDVEYCREIQNDLWNAIYDAGMESRVEYLYMPHVYSRHARVQIRLTDHRVELLIKGLEAMGDPAHKGSALGEIFGGENA